MVCKWKLCKCAEKKKKNDRFVKVFVNVYVCMVDLCFVLYNRFVVDMCMSSLPRTLLHSNLSSKYPLFLIYSLYPCSFYCVLQIDFAWYCCSLFFGYMLISLPWWCIMIVFKVVSIRCNANIRYHFESYKTGCKPIFLYISYMIYIGTFEV